MSDDQVKRYQLDYHHTQTYAEMVEDCDGDWVKYNDYKAASDRIEKLEAKLAKAVEAERERCAKVAESVALPMDGRNAKAQADYMSKVIASAIRAELKGQDDE